MHCDRRGKPFGAFWNLKRASEKTTLKVFLREKTVPIRWVFFRCYATDIIMNEIQNALESNWIKNTTFKPRPDIFTSRNYSFRINKGYEQNSVHLSSLYFYCTLTKVFRPERSSELIGKHHKQRKISRSACFKGI